MKHAYTHTHNDTTHTTSYDEENTHACDTKTPTYIIDKLFWSVGSSTTSKVV